MGPFYQLVTGFWVTPRRALCQTPAHWGEFSGEGDSSESLAHQQPRVSGGKSVLSPGKGSGWDSKSIYGTLDPLYGPAVLISFYQ